MPKKIPQNIKDKAFELYLPGDKTAEDIVYYLNKEFKMSIKPVTIYSWAKQNDWKALRTQARSTAIEQVQETESQRFARLQSEHLDTYEQMRHKSKHELDSLLFDRAIDAARIADMSIQGERKVMEGLLEMQFIQDVINVLIEEVSDPTVLDKVAIRLRTLVTQEN